MQEQANQRDSSRAAPATTALPGPMQGVRAWEVVEIEGEATPVPTTPTEPAPAPPAIVDQHDDWIVAGLDSRRLTVTPGEATSVRLALLNNGERHARFRVHVEGWIDERWVTINRGDEAEAGPTAQLWLHPGERALLTITLRPARTASSTAGERALVVVVRTDEYGKRSSRLGATLVIEPYHEVTLGELQPRQLRTSRQQRTAQLLLPVTNRSNTAVELFVQGHDPQRRCRMTFAAPGARQTHSRRTTFALPAGQTATIAVQVAPPPPALFALRTRSIPLRLAVGLLQAQSTPLAATATVITRPLIGAWHLLAFALTGMMAVAVALVMTAVGAMLAWQSAAAPTPAPAVVQPAPAPPVTIIINLAQPAPTTAAPASAAAFAPPAALAPIVHVPPVDASAGATLDSNAPVVRLEQVTAPGQAAQPVGFLPAQPADQQAAPQSPARRPQTETTYQQMFQEVALRYDLNWRVLAAQAYLESSFDALALGSSGDMGLMQILPGTWREWAPVVEAADPFDAYSNVLVAAAYLDYLRSKLGERSHPQIEWMLVAYNWGIDKVGDHLEAGLGWDDLPAERRQYAEEILRVAETIPLE
jgi:membrane-bound lytic murein transglycosylase F